MNSTDTYEDFLLTMDVHSPYKKDDKVTGIVYEIIQSFGAFVAIDNKYSALIPTKELHKNIKVGDIIEARVTNIREDGKLNLSLVEKSYIQIDIDANMILEKLINNSGFLPFNDKSSVQKIEQEFGISKSAFKRAIGNLFKKHKILIKQDGIYLSQKSPL